MYEKKGFVCPRMSTHVSGLQISGQDKQSQTACSFEQCMQVDGPDMNVRFKYEDMNLNARPPLRRSTCYATPSVSRHECRTPRPVGRSISEGTQAVYYCTYKL
ncbi:unnamed protein product [Arctia plantaginis]|uniref:Uncharacterized protein n=1 Tax=Arctia plantaginis TaxID=874455 RepID=A0A8S1BFE1_ARCPL|nr:unnamed protein product [Arctia plantaginis]